jgi:hypothetical protein
VSELSFRLLVVLVQGPKSPLSECLFPMEPCQLLRVLTVLSAELQMRLLMSRDFGLFLGQQKISPL